jgi:hypothetical protein
MLLPRMHGLVMIVPEPWRVVRKNCEAPLELLKLAHPVRAVCRLDQPGIFRRLSYEIVRG